MLCAVLLLQDPGMLLLCARQGGRHLPSWLPLTHMSQKHRSHFQLLTRRCAGLLPHPFRLRWPLLIGCSALSLPFIILPLLVPDTPGPSPSITPQGLPSSPTLGKGLHHHFLLPTLFPSWTTYYN